MYRIVQDHFRQDPARAAPEKVERAFEGVQVTLRPEQVDYAVHRFRRQVIHSDVQARQVRVFKDGIAQYFRQVARVY